MSETKDPEKLLSALQSIPPSELSYQQWCCVGMALKQEGFPVTVWEDWSRADSRFHAGECAKKWRSFRGTGTPVTGGSIISLAHSFGWRPPSDGRGRALDWDDEISAKGDSRPAPGALPAPMGTPVQQLTTYLETLFEAEDLVGYVTEVWEQDGKYLPRKGNYDRTAGQLIEELAICDGDIGAVFGDCNPEAGAWIRFNPLDGEGVRNDNVTRFDYALVESDSMPVEQQYALYRQLELPVACLVSSGGKSLHAIVRVDAHNYAEYQKRVEYLYGICQEHGLSVDRQNKNPSRLSRMPGVTRKGVQQSLLGVNLGRESWQAWADWAEEQHDDLPDTERLSDVFGSLPPLAAPLIDGVLRKGHKLLLAGPSKAGKSFALIELCIAIAEGTRWLGMQCAQGRVLYVNLELDKASCLHRFADVYRALGLQPKHLDCIDIWNLRGRSVPMDKLAPKLIRRAHTRDYVAVVIDPIYKVITGDENSADQMAAFCNQFDKVCTELGCAVIYCHHHSKGAQGGKRSMDRASGSGVFARDPDALLDMIQLELNEDVKQQQADAAVSGALTGYLREKGKLEDVSLDDLCTEKHGLAACGEVLSPEEYQEAEALAAAAKTAAGSATAWRIEATLREFAAPPPLNLWFRYPVHQVDGIGVLGDLAPEDAVRPSWQSNLSKSGKRTKTPEERKQDRANEIEQAFECCASMEEPVTVAAIAEYMGKSEDTIRRHLKESKKFWISDGEVGRKKEKRTD